MVSLAYLMAHRLTHSFLSLNFVFIIFVVPLPTSPLAEILPSCSNNDSIASPVIESNDDSLTNFVSPANIVPVPKKTVKTGENVENLVNF